VTGPDARPGLRVITCAAEADAAVTGDQV